MTQTLKRRTLDLATLTLEKGAHDPDHTLTAIELATLLAEVVRHTRTSYGSPEEWRRDFTRAVNIYQALINQGSL